MLVNSRLNTKWTRKQVKRYPEEKQKKEKDRKVHKTRDTGKALTYRYLESQKWVRERVGQKQYQKKYSEPEKRHQATDSRGSMELKHLKYEENHLEVLLKADENQRHGFSNKNKGMRRQWDERK